MSNGRRTAALVCEGPTDIPLLDALIRILWPEVDNVLRLQPEVDGLDKPLPGSLTGWSEVRAWCERNAPHLRSLLSGTIGDPIDLLVVALDVDIAIAAGIVDPPTKASPYEARRLCDTVKGWLRPPRTQNLPPELVIALPAMASEAWVVAALFPKEKRPEAVENPAELLVKKRKLSRKANGKPHKELHKYQAFGDHVAARLGSVRARCPECERLCVKIEHLRDRVEKAA